MKKCHLAYLACAAALATTGLGAAPAAATHTTLLVRPGESIQKAVNAAQPGDTVLVLPGTYHESVTIKTPRVTLTGTGLRTVIEPGATKTAPQTTAKAAEEAAAKAAEKTTAKGAAKTTAKAGRGTAPRTPKSCAEDGNGICVLGTKTKNVEGVTVSDLTVTGFSRAGVFGMATDTMTVRHVNAFKNGVWGIAQERSVHGVIEHNRAHENGDAGVFLANTITEEAGAYDAGATLVRHNRLDDNRIGITLRRLRNLTVERNGITGNCAGVFVIGDENKPKAGHLTVTRNVVTRNNKFCAKTERLPALQGAGIVLTGTEQTRVSDNVVTHHSGTSVFSGGVVLFKSFVGVTSDKNSVEGNLLSDNSPADLVNAATGKGNTFQRNSCRASKPAGLC
ncbi:nitrous oxide reductase family maturation protein NosD [Streptomyces sp. NPDC048297]|uniref:right-handed parallel beta-helix repeat-containing protein n=1 Tax=Streptomyces sp. NPDC048297 TaxID=3365531 RepID=UPI0037221841